MRRARNHYVCTKNGPRRISCKWLPFKSLLTIRNPQKALERIQKATKIDFVGHDFRRTAASLMTGMGIPRLTVKKILNHVEREITAVYDRHSYDAEKRDALEAWAERLITVVSEKPATQISGA